MEYMRYHELKCPQEAKSYYDLRFEELNVYK